MAAFHFGFGFLYRIRFERRRSMSASPLVILRGGGDLATGAAQALHRAGFRLLLLETPRPTAIRRSVALCEAVYGGAAQVEDILCRLVRADDEMTACHRENKVPITVDPEGNAIARLKPAAVVDAILAKKNLGTHRAMAPVTVALGPGFCAGEDVDIVIETMRGHDLGRLIFAGPALPNTGVPGEMGGQTALRVIHAPLHGPLRCLRRIGDIVTAGDPILTVGAQTVTAPIGGLLRGLIRDGFEVRQGMKIADIDPRKEVNWRTVSDKARCLGGAVLQALMLRLRLANGGPCRG
jgi:xanthine dehydrogenase accessory factor